MKKSSLYLMSILLVEQKESFQNKYKLEYYASHTMIINKDYIGDHSLLIADEIISNNVDVEKKILDIITHNETGILYHTSLTKRIFQNRYDVEDVYARLVNKIDKYKNIKIEQKPKSEIVEDIKISQYFKGFNIAMHNDTKGVFSEK